MTPKNFNQILEPNIVFDQQKILPKISFRELIQKTNKKWKYGFRPDFWLTPPLPLKFGSKNRYQSPETVPRFYFNTSKMKTKKVWIWGLTPPPLLWTKSILSFFFGWAPLTNIFPLNKKMSNQSFQQIFRQWAASIYHNVCVLCVLCSD